MNESNSGFSAVSMEELSQIEGGNGRDIYTGDQSKYRDVALNGGNISPPSTLGALDAYRQGPIHPL